MGLPKLLDFYLGREVWLVSAWFCLDRVKTLGDLILLLIDKIVLQDDLKLILCRWSQTRTLDAYIVFYSLDMGYARDGNINQPSCIQVRKSLGASVHLKGFLGQTAPSFNILIFQHTRLKFEQWILLNDLLLTNLVIEGFYILR